MKSEDLMKLIDAGFTKDEILKLVEPITQEHEPVAETTEPTTQVEENTENNEATTSNVDVATEMFNKLTESMDAFNKKVEAFNMVNAEMDVENKGNETLEDILARVLIPNGKKEVK